MNPPPWAARPADAGPNSAEPPDRGGSFQAAGQPGPAARSLPHLPRELPDVVVVRIHAQVGEVGGVQLAGLADGLRCCSGEQPLGLCGWRSWNYRASAKPSAENSLSEALRSGAQPAQGEIRIRHLACVCHDDFT